MLCCMPGALCQFCRHQLSIASSFFEFCLDSLCFCMAPLANLSAARSLADSSWTRNVGPASSSKTRGVDALAVQKMSFGKKNKQIVIYGKVHVHHKFIWAQMLPHYMMCICNVYVCIYGVRFCVSVCIGLYRYIWLYVYFEASVNLSKSH